MNREEMNRLLWEIDWNNKPGIHTFSMCKCNREGYRGETSACNQCLKERFRNLER